MLDKLKTIRLLLDIHEADPMVDVSWRVGMARRLVQEIINSAEGKTATGPRGGS